MQDRTKTRKHCPRGSYYNQDTINVKPNSCKISFPEMKFIKKTKKLCLNFVFGRCF